MGVINTVHTFKVHGQTSGSRGLLVGDDRLLERSFSQGFLSSDQSFLVRIYDLVHEVDLGVLLVDDPVFFGETGER